MYVIVKTIDTNNFEYFSMLAASGIYTDANLAKAVIFPNVTVANKMKDVLNALDSDITVTVKEIVLEDVNQ